MVPVVEEKQRLKIVLRPGVAVKRRGGIDGEDRVGSDNGNAHCDSLMVGKDLHTPVCLVDTKDKL